jgi:hypothetical protein
MTDTTKQRSSVDVRSLRLTSNTGEPADLQTHLVELNLFEDIFGNAVGGSLIVHDLRNLIRDLRIEGDETLFVDLLTDRFVDSPEMHYRKEFRVYSVSDRMVDHQKGSQMYVLNFCSKEVFKDTLTPLYRPFEGDSISAVVQEIYDEYIRTPRYPGGPDLPIAILDPCANPVKFISPGWTPFKCINWLASKSISANGSACNYLFWESSKRYYFGSIEEIFRQYRTTNITIGYYGLKPRDINYNIKYPGAPDVGILDFFALDEASIENASDQLKLTSEGELASKVLSVDLNRKEFINVIYDHVERFGEYTHLGDAAPWGPTNTVNPENSLAFVSKNSRLFDEFPNNVNEVYKDVFGRRYSNLRDIQNFKLNIIIPGRTDIQAGNMIELLWPDTPMDKTSTGDLWTDRRYSGPYLVTSIRHKITPFMHECALEIVRDAFPNTLGADGTLAYQDYGLVLDPNTGQLIESI